MKRMPFIFLFAFFILLPVVVVPFLTSGYTLPKFALLYALIVCFACFAAVRWSEGGSIGWRKGVLVPAAVAIGWTALTAAVAVNPHLSYAVLFRLLLLVIFLLTASSFLDEEDIRPCFMIIVVTGSLVALYGILQYCGIDPFPPEQRKTALSTLGNRNFFSEYLVAILPLAAILLLSAGTGKVRIGFLLTFLLIFCGLIVTETKAGWIAATAGMVSLAVFLVWRRNLVPSWRRNVLVGFSGLMLLAGGLVAIPSARAILVEQARRTGRGLEAGEGSVALRMTVWKETLRMVRDHPVFGIGAGNFAIIYPRYQGRETLFREVRMERAHSDFLQTAAETGISGLLLWMGFIFFVAWKVFLMVKTASRFPTFLLAAGTAGSLVAVAVNALIAFPLQNPVVLLHCWFFLAVTTVLTERRRECLPATRNAGLKTVFIVAAVLLIGFSLRPLIADGFLSAGLRAAKRGDTGRAVSLLRSSIAWEPANYVSRFHLGTLYLSLRRPEPALEELSRSLLLHPYYAQTHGNLAIAHAYLGDDRKAREEFDAAINLNPTHPEFYNNFGAFLLETGDREGAIRQFRSSVDVAPDFMPGYANLGYALLKTGRRPEAVAVWKEGLRRNPDFLPLKDLLKHVQP